MILNYNNIWCSVEHAEQEEVEFIIKTLTYSDPNARHTKAFKKKRWDGKRSLYSKRFKNFPTGLLPLVIEKLKKKNIPFQLIDSRPDFLQPDFLEIKCKYSLWYHQKKAIKEFTSKPTGRRGIFQLPTRSGKATIAGYLMTHLNIPSLMIVPEKRLLYQLGEEFQSVFNMDVGILGDSILEPRLHNLAIVNTIARYLKEPRKGEDPDKFNQKKALIYGLLQRIEFLIIDEFHAHYDDYSLISRSMPKARWRLGLSATPLLGHKGQKLKAQAITGPLIYKQTIKQLVDKGLVLRPTITFIQCNHEPSDSSFKKAYREGIVYNDKRNKMIAIIAITKYKTNKKVLILVESIKHGNLLLDIFKSKQLNVDFVYGDHSADERSEAIRKIQNEELDILITSRIFNQGIDIPSLDCVIVAGGYKSKILGIQRYGRPLTAKEGKTEAEVYDFFDKGSYYLEKHSQERIALVQKEKAYDIEFKTIGELT